MEQHMAMLAAETAKTKSEIARANEKTEAEQLERMRLEVEIAGTPDPAGRRDR